MRHTLHYLLEFEGYTVIDASDGHQGIQRYKDTPTDVVITDLRMPEKEGSEFCTVLLPLCRHLIAPYESRIDTAFYLNNVDHTIIIEVGIRSLCPRRS